MSYWRMIACSTYLEDKGIATGGFIMESLGSQEHPIGIGEPDSVPDISLYRCVQIHIDTDSSIKE